MFEYVRQHNKIFQLLLFLLIVPSFVLFGLQGYSRFQERGATVARVDGHDITQQDWDNAHRNEVERMRQQAPNLDAKVLDSPAFKYATLERLVRERVLQAAVEKERLPVSDQRLARELQSNQLITMLRGPDGKLDMERYRQILASQGMTPEMYENQMRSELSLRQVVAGVTGSGVASPAQANVSLGRFFERREVQVARFEPKDFVAKIDPTDADLEAFYKKNEKQFQAPETASIEYVVLDLPSIAKTVTVNEADLKTYYDENVKKQAAKEERRASHILVTVAKSASADDKAKAKAKAQELLAQVRKAPDSFADVAKKNSQDPGSAEKGGDLDYFTRGAMTKPFEDAVFAMKKGDISDLVESEFGWHIIKLTDVKAVAAQTFEEMKPKLEEEAKKQQAQKKYAEAAEQFTNAVYEQSDSLKPVADKLKLEIRKADNIQRAPQPGQAGPLANPKFLAALFSPDATERKRNTEALETAPNTMVSGRIVQHQPARTRPLAEVKQQVRDKLVAERAAEMAKKEGEAKLAAWQARPDSASLPAPMPIGRQDADKQPRELIEAALRAASDKLPAFVGADLGAQGYAVVRVNKVLPRDAMPAEQAQAEVASYLRAWEAVEGMAYYNLLKDRYKSEIRVPKPADTPPMPER